MSNIIDPVSGGSAHETVDKATIDRQNKIIVALFLILGKAMERVPINDRNLISVSETEIAKAWKAQKSPVRLISSMEVNAGSTSNSGEDDEWKSVHRVFRVVPGDLDLSKTGLNLKGKMPKEEDRPATAHHKQRRVFDLE